MKRICVFCGSRTGTQPQYTSAAIALAQSLAGAGVGLVYGGGNVGLMGVMANAMIDLNAEVIGVIPRFMDTKEIANERLKDLRVVSSMHERKSLMADLSDGFIALPGGFGTFEELCEIVTWSQLGLHQKPTGLLNVGGFYQPLLNLFDRAVQDGFIETKHRSLVLHSDSPEALLQMFRDYKPLPLPQWIRSSDES